jgi:hypothetical protein
MNGLKGRIATGPADPSIFNKDRGMRSIHDEYIKYGSRFSKGDNRPGSRERSFVLFRQMLKAAVVRNIEQPWLLVTRGCVNMISQIPELPISPENPQDVYTGANDHLYDAGRYRVLKSQLVAGTQEVSGT